MGPSLMHRIFRDSYHSDGWMRLDASPFYDISYITFGPWAAEDIGAGQPHGQAIKSQCFGRGWHAQSSTPEGERSEVQEESFFDPRDIVQVKYEMLRRVSVDKMSVTQVSDEYGVTRPTFYQAKADFEGAGIAGLVPRKRGPRGPHKIQSEVLAFLKAQVSPGEPIRARELTNLVRGEFGLDVHPKNDRARARFKKHGVTGGGQLHYAMQSRGFGRAIRIAAHSRAWHGAASGESATLHAVLRSFCIAVCGPGFVPVCPAPPDSHPLPCCRRSAFRSRTKFLNNARSSTCSPTMVLAVSERRTA